MTEKTLDNQLSPEQAIMAIIKMATQTLIKEGKLLEESAEEATKAANSLLMVAIRFGLQANDDDHQSVSQIKDSIHDEFDDLLIGINVALKALELLPNLTDNGQNSERIKDEIRYFLETFAAA